MNKFGPLAVLVTVAMSALILVAGHAAALVTGVAPSPGTVPIRIAQGRMIYAAHGQRLAPVDRVNGDGSVEFIMEGHLLTVPATILSDVQGRLTSSRTRLELLR